MILLVILITKSVSCNGQFVKNNSGELILGLDYFSQAEIASNRIKTVSISFFQKKPLKPIREKEGEIEHFLFDTSGRIIRFYQTKRNYYGDKDTTVEWRYYKNNLLQTIKKTQENYIKTQSIFYQNGLPSVEIFGKSKNNSFSKIEQNITEYKEDYAEYINYAFATNGDTIISRRNLGGKTFERIIISHPDSNKKVLQTEYPYSINQNTERIFDYQKGVLKTLTCFEPSNEKYAIHFNYDSQQNLTSYSKTNLKWNSTESFSELLYDENTGNLQAIITKNYYTDEIFITKFHYTYYS